MLKLPSLKSLLSDAISTLKRFPLALISSIAGTLIGIYLIHCDYIIRRHQDHLLQAIMCCYLGLMLFIALELFCETKKWNTSKRLILQSIGLVVLTIYYFSLSKFDDFTITTITRYVLYAIGLHLLVSFAPFFEKNQLNGFWQYNKFLFLRILLSCLYTGVLFLGLALALLAIDQLFKVKIKDNVYFDLWWLLAGIFNTYFFLAGIPKNISTLDETTDYPKGLKVFTQFILLPLIAIYLVILYAYCIKILLVLELPKGWVSYLVLSFSIVGILAILLIWPIREQENNTWIKKVSQLFFISLFPLIVLLILAIYERVAEYGITENRYFVIILTLWLLATTLYFLFSQKKSIKLIPVSLCLMAFFSSFGPWGAFSVSERSQVKRLEKLLIQENILVDGKIKKTSTLLKGIKAGKIVDIINYLDKTHGYDAMAPWFTENIDSIFAKAGSSKDYPVYKQGIVLSLLGVDNYSGYYDYRGQRSFYFHLPYTRNNTASTVSGFDYYCELNQYYYESRGKEYNNEWIYFGNDSMKVWLDDITFNIQKENTTTQTKDLTGILRPLIKNDSNYYGDFIIDPEQINLVTKIDSLFIRFDFTTISGTINEKDSLAINNINGHILIKNNK